jgi:hypothetical protein
MRSMRPRKIHVAGEDYLWVISRTHTGYPGYVTLKVFSPMNRAGQRVEVRFRFDDPWLNYGPMISTARERFSQIWALQPVTPGQVAQVIEAARKKGWRPADKGSPLRFHFDAGESKTEEES